MTRTNTRSLSLALALCALAAGCHGSNSSHFIPGPSSPATIPEIEVNDFAFEPQFIGTVYPGDQLFIEGSITDAGWDPRDGFQLFADTPMIVNVNLDAHVPGVDLDWCVWDPSVGAYTVCAETEFDPEIGTFIVLPPGNEFHMVVSSFSGTSTYTMELTFAPYFGAEVADTNRAPEFELPTSRSDSELEYGISEEWMKRTPAEPIFSGALFDLSDTSTPPTLLEFFAE